MNTSRLATTFALALLTLPAARSQAQSVQVTQKLEELQAIAVRDSNDPAAHYNLALGYWSKKRYGDAESSLHQAIQIDPQFADAYLALGVVRNWDSDHWKQLQKEKGDSGVREFSRIADGYYRKAFLINPLVDIKILGGTYRFGNRNSRFIRAFEDLVEGRYDKAYEALSKEMVYWGGAGGIDSTPEIVLWLHSLAGAHTNQYDPAIADLDNLIGRLQRVTTDSEPEIPLLANEYRYMTAALHQKAGRPERAVSLYLEVAEQDLGNYMAHVQLARIAEGSGNYELAIKERRRAVDANPDDAFLLTELGVTLGKSGNMAEAVDILEKAADQNPRDVRPLFWLGVGYSSLGRNADARTAYTQFLERVPSRYDKQIAAAKDRLAKLPQ